MIWYLENLQRNRAERGALEALASSVTWLTSLGWRIDADLRLVWGADIAIPAGNRPVSLRFPNHFPYSPPLVLPRGDTTRWSQHQWGPGNELCLEYGSDNWHPDLTGADMITSAHRLLEGERPAPDQTAEVASRHETTLGQDLRNTFSRLLVTRSLVAVLDRIPENVLLTANALGMYHGDSFVQVVSSITFPGGNVWREELPESDSLGIYRPIAVLRWPQSLPLPSTENLSGFRAALAENAMALPKVRYAVMVRGKRIRVYFLNEDDDSFFETSIIPAQPVTPRLDEKHSQLASRKVGIVGCGSLGSKLAVSMARSGVGKFLLIDDDILLPDNLVRHDLDWREVGRHKADSVSVKIQLVNPKAERAVRKHRLGGQEASGSIETLIEYLGTCDLIIDATADPAVFNYLSAASAVSKKPMVWAEIFGGGFGGLVARHRPALDPDPATMRRIIENWCAEKGQPIERAARSYGGSPSAPAIADDAEVTVIAGHAARLAIDLLIPRDPSIFPYSVYLIGLAGHWNFTQPFETHPIDVGPPLAQHEVTMDEESANAERALIRRLFEEYANASSSGSAGDEAAAT
jgi:hypothetical protein